MDDILCNFLKEKHQLDNVQSLNSDPGIGQSLIYLVKVNAIRLLICSFIHSNIYSESAIIEM